MARDDGAKSSSIISYTWHSW